MNGGRLLKTRGQNGNAMQKIKIVQALHLRRCVLVASVVINRARATGVRPSIRPPHF